MLATWHNSLVYQSLEVRSPWVLYTCYVAATFKVGDNLSASARMFFETCLVDGTFAVVSVACAVGVLYGFWLIGTGLRGQGGKSSSSSTASGRVSNHLPNPLACDR